MTLQLALNLLALILTVTGTLLMYRFTPKVNSQTHIRSRAEQEDIRKKDAQAGNDLQGHDPFADRLRGPGHCPHTSGKALIPCKHLLLIWIY